MLKKQHSVSSMPVVRSKESLDCFSPTFKTSMDDLNVHSSDEMVVRKKPLRASSTGLDGNTHSSDEMVVRQKKPLRTGNAALDKHMVKRRPKKSEAPSGAASLAGHELQMKKKKMRGPVSDLSLPGEEGLTRKISGSASVAGDQVARRPVARRPVNRTTSLNSNDEISTPMRRKPGVLGQPRTKKAEQAIQP